MKVRNCVKSQFWHPQGRSPQCILCMRGERGFAVLMVLLLIFHTSWDVNCFEHSEDCIARMWRQYDHLECRGQLVQWHSFMSQTTWVFGLDGPESCWVWWRREKISTTRNGTWLSSSSSPYQLCIVLQLHYLWLM
jgi:hypothetical protein